MTSKAIRSILGLSTALLCLSSCQTNNTNIHVADDPRVSSHCAPVKSLLSKNYRREKHVNSPILKAGDLTERTGATVSGQEAARLSQVDSLCRAWVFGALKPDEYAKGLMDLLAATIAQTTSDEERGPVTEANVQALHGLKKEGVVPEAVNPDALPPKVENDARLTAEELEERVRTSVSALDGKIARFYDEEAARQNQILAKLDQMSAKLDNINGPRSLKQDDGISPTMVRRYEVFFATSSVEITYGERLRLEEAAKVWASAGSGVEVVGYADPRGDAAVNERISAARAEVVADFLKRHSVNVMSVRGGGVAKGSDDNDFLRVVKIQVK